MSEWMLNLLNSNVNDFIMSSNLTFQEETFTQRRESERLDALHHLNLLDTPPEARFDRITKLAARFFQVPTALVTLVDRDRQWFKSCFGWQDAETSRDVSFCSYTILSDEVFVIPDALQDHRFKNNPLVIGGPAIRFYAGAPLNTPDGYNIGALCLIDTQPREFSIEQCANLQDLAALVIDEIQLRQEILLREERNREEARRESEQMLRMVIDTIPQSVFWKDRNSVYMGCNARFAHLAGINHPRDVVRKTILDLAWSSEESEKWRADDNRIMEGDQPEHGIIDVVVSPDGKRVEYETSRLPLHDPKGNVIGILGVSEDVTEKRRVAQALKEAHQGLQQAHAELETRVQLRTRELAQANADLEATNEALQESEALKGAILETSLDCIITIDHRGNVVEWNPATEETFGYARADVIGQPLHDLIIPPEFREAHQHGLQTYLKSGYGPVLGKRLELPAVRQDGSRIIVELAIVPILGHDPLLFTGHLRDITQRKHEEAALQQARQAAEVARLEADRANLAKSQFLSRMSHELRTPLNSILGFTQILQMDELAADQADMVNDIYGAGQHLLSLINEVLDIARIEEGDISFDLETVCGADAVAECVSLLNPLALQRGVQIRNDLGTAHPYVLAEKRRLHQVLMNLISNAIKYNVENGEVSIYCEDRPPNPELEVSERWRIWVRDTGGGIAADRLPDLFTPFDRMGAEKTDVEGTGLGLVLSKGLVEAMGGSIGVENVPGEGCAFWIELPIARVDPLPAKGAEVLRLNDIRARFQTGTVLCIEDNAANLALVERILNPFKELELFTAATGESGLELAWSKAPSLILLDINLPDVNGIQVIEKLRRDTRTRLTPIIVLSADASPSQIERATHTGANDYLTKPFEVEVLLDAIKKLLPETV